MSIRTNQSQEPLRTNTLYSSNSKGSLYPPNKTLLPNSGNPIPYNPYGLREEHSSHTTR